MIVLICILVWLVCSIVSFGGLFAYHQRAYPTVAKEWYRRDRSFSLFIGLFGPFALIPVAGTTDLFSYGFYFGKSFSGQTEEE